MIGNIIKRAECAVKESKEKFVATVSGVTFPSSNRSGEDVMVKDVLSSGGPAQAKFATNPITGPNLQDIKEEKVADEKAVAAVVSKCVKNFDIKNDEMLVVTLNLTQIRAPKNVYVTSFMCLFVNHAQKTFNMKVLMENIKNRKKEGLLFTAAIGGATRTALVIPVMPEDVKNMEILKVTMNEGAAMNTMKNKPSRSGGIVTFIQMTKGPIDKGAVKDEKMKERMLKMLAAAKAKMEDPENAKMPSFPLSSSK
ncbi:hypothetical protein ADEAN_000106300 [Angomonas deanei]|uniref:Uncharacterized protein n=1 Tax=Angomonas deanei TaxID=59799 RepID=A0A7G2C1M5_9TRYP|nr:hypothetical protein ADEAN_000106300 [Angomonas deanei]